jgi:hypothetical protein
MEINITIGFKVPRFLGFKVKRKSVNIKKLGSEVRE